MIKHGLAAVALSAASQLASAQTYAFDCITNTSATNCNAGEAQLRVAVSGPSAQQALFSFTNVGSAALSLTDVYFDDGTLLGIASISSGPGVVFSRGATPGNLPGGNAVGFEAIAAFGADSEAPVQPNGVNPGETLGILFNLQAGRSFADVISELSTGEMRIGLHVQGYANGGSESLVNLTSPVPEPSSALYMLSALGVMASLRLVARRKGA